MNAPTDPALLSRRRALPQRVRGLRARLAGSRRRAAVVTSAALLSAGSLATLVDAPEPEVVPASHVSVATVSAPTPEAEPAPLTLLPADTAGVPIHTVSDAGEGTFHSEGRASYYGRELAGNPTASGDRFDPSDLTAAHRTLPFGTRVRVTNQRNGESVVVRVNDRGPFHGNRIIDVSRAAADEIGMTGRGTATVTLDVLPEAPHGVRG